MMFCLYLTYHYHLRANNTGCFLPDQLDTDTRLQTTIGVINGIIRIAFTMVSYCNVCLSVWVCLSHVFLCFSRVLLYVCFLCLSVCFLYLVRALSKNLKTIICKNEEVARERTTCRPYFLTCNFSK